MTQITLAGMGAGHFDRVAVGNHCRCRAVGRERGSLVEGRNEIRPPQRRRIDLVKRSGIDGNGAPGIDAAASANRGGRVIEIGAEGNGDCRARLSLRCRRWRIQIANGVLPLQSRRLFGRRGGWLRSFLRLRHRVGRNRCGAHIGTRFNRRGDRDRAARLNLFAAGKNTAPADVGCNIIDINDKPQGPRHIDIIGRHLRRGLGNQSLKLCGKSRDASKLFLFVLDGVHSIAKEITARVLSCGRIGLDTRQLSIDVELTRWIGDVAEHVHIFNDRDLLLGSVDRDAASDKRRTIEERVGFPLLPGNGQREGIASTLAGHGIGERAIAVERLGLHDQIATNRELGTTIDCHLGSGVHHTDGQRNGNPLDRAGGCDNIDGVVGGCPEGEIVGGLDLSGHVDRGCCLDHAERSAHQIGNRWFCRCFCRGNRMGQHRLAGDSGSAAERDGGGGGRERERREGRQPVHGIDHCLPEVIHLLPDIDRSEAKVDIAGGHFPRIVLLGTRLRRHRQGAAGDRSGANTADCDDSRVLLAAVEPKTENPLGVVGGFDRDIAVGATRVLRSREKFSPAIDRDALALERDRPGRGCSPGVDRKTVEVDRVGLDADVLAIGIEIRRQRAGCQFDRGCGGRCGWIPQHPVEVGLLDRAFSLHRNNARSGARPDIHFCPGDHRSNIKHKRIVSKAALERVRSAHRAERNAPEREG